MDKSHEADAHRQYRYEQMFSVWRKLRMLSAAELFAYILSAIGIVVYRSYKHDGFLNGIPNLFGSNSFLFLMALSAFASFLYILGDLTPLVSLMRRFRSLSSRIFGSNISFDIQLSNLDASQAKIQNEQIQTVIENQILRTADTFRRAQSRPNALLFAGFLIAIIGLAFFLYTLPSISNIADAVNNDLSYWAYTAQFVPRILMLLFIQLLAGFFLRQYRSSMEDFRHFESIHRQRELLLISYLIRRDHPNSRPLIAMASDLLKPGAEGVLKVGETTAAIEALKHERNELSGLLSIVSSVATASQKPKASKN